MKEAISARHQGFTLVELLVAILLLSILTATAFPNFGDVATNAHTAVTQGAQDSQQTSTAMFATGVTNDVNGANECAVIYSKLLEAGSTPAICPLGFAAVPLL